MTTKQITVANVNEQRKLLYQTAFPEDEPIPWEDLVRLIGEMHLDFTAYYEGENFIGFTIVFPHEPFNWYWYFAVLPEYRRRGIAKRLIEATKAKADCMGIPCVGLLVDKGNPSGEALYSSVGLRYADASMWGGHQMKHLIL